MINNSLDSQLFHKPVMVNEVIEGLNCLPGRVYVDCTLGGAGHSSLIASLIRPDGELISLDVDEDAIKYSTNLLKQFDNVTIIKDNYRNLPVVLEKLGKIKINGGILIDLGASYYQLTSPERGFSFSNESSLDMRMDKELSETAEDIINTYGKKELARIFFDYGEERYSNKIAEAIVKKVKTKKIKTTTQLADIVKAVVPRSRTNKLHPATRIFQALRIAVNNELENLKLSLDNFLTLMTPGARIVVITFHSLEDRIVKQYFKYWSVDCVCPVNIIECRCEHTKKLKIITKKPIVPAEEEVLSNSAARSAKLRIAERV